ncbi:response regulator transcription factor [Peptoniphilus indolicus]|uniref:Response regulator n=2 Tax=Peptoniphilus indolicus TaxID=33030 RepID=G4D3A6_9FIRM|nr:response regulator transcription factor [Peptoniphilus indolicus]EGY79989.1 response regulator [Peptoniphilus indolicus ATCC 29427]SUB75033.1 Phosphate regulon transcriptional regulatory protein phoB [Peptoniphilus indolicus]
MNKILLIEDDRQISDSIKSFLDSKGYQTTTAYSYTEAITKLDENFDLAILDLNLPDESGIILLKKLKDRNTRVIIATVKDDENFIVEALDKGADDYLTKPFNLSVLRARIDASLRTIPIKVGNKIEVGECVLDLDKAIIFYESKQVDFTSLEYEVMSLFIKNPNRIFTREQLLERFWENKNQFVNDNTLTATIRRIRNKTSKTLLKTVRGIGYRMEIL